MRLSLAFRIAWKNKINMPVDNQLYDKKARYTRRSVNFSSTQPRLNLPPLATASRSFAAILLVVVCIYTLPTWRIFRPNQQNSGNEGMKEGKGRILPAYRDLSSRVREMHKLQCIAASTIGIMDKVTSGDAPPSPPIIPRFSISNFHRLGGGASESETPSPSPSLRTAIHSHRPSATVGKRRKRKDTHRVMGRKRSGPEALRI